MWTLPVRGLMYRNNRNIPAGFQIAFQFLLHLACFHQHLKGKKTYLNISDIKPIMEVWNWGLGKTSLHSLTITGL